MGSGIIAVAAATLPRSFPGLGEAATVVWAGTALLLIALTASYVGQRALRVHAGDPVLAQFLGAPPIALLTVGAGTLLLGRRLIGERAAVDVDWVLWSVGTVLGLATVCAVPYLMVTRHRFAPDAAFGGWLLPVVPPMVSAATGALLVPRVPAGQIRLALLLGCWAATRCSGSACSRSCWCWPWCTADWCTMTLPVVRSFPRCGSVWGR
ncbi:hypothetical protein [Streptomyces sp. NPDC058385]|uniref:SLAC1 family transporter n=1 Tax=Streptomyces sp. NPDC058385 TaxID=3346473 RepID=UPI003652840F